MEKLTDRFLLERTGTKNLEQIKTLNLSHLGLKCKDLPVELLSQLRSLEHLDLSGNQLQELPRGLALPKLHSLNLAGNEIEDVTTLDSLTSLVELNLEDNIYITINDCYKLMALLPQLRMYNGKDIGNTSDHVRHTSENILRIRVVAVWQERFCLPQTSTPKTVATLERDFVNAAQCHVRYGPSSIKEYTKWRVAIIAKEYLHSLLRPNEEEDKSQEPTITMENNVTASPTKRRHAESQSNQDVRLTPRRKASAEAGGSSAEETSGKPKPLAPRTVGSPRALRTSPRKASRLPTSPAKRVKNTANPEQLSKEDVGRPKRKAGGDEGLATGAGKHRAAEKSPRKKSCVQERMNLEVIHVLQCHSKQDSPEDFSTQLWACAFKPPDCIGDTSDHGDRLVATCGGDTVCLIDCETGMVINKYKEPGEEFFSLAWSTVQMSRGDGVPPRPSSIIAAGGKKGVVHLIHPRAGLAYGELRASRKAISSLRFSPRQGHLLFTGAYDNKVILWDIGGVDSQHNFNASQLLVLEGRSTPLHLCLPPASRDTHLLVASDDGLICFNTQLNKGSAKRTAEMEITFPIYKEEDKERKYRTIDGLSFLTDDIVASKSHMQHSIYLWSWSQTRKQPLNKRTRMSSAVLLAELQWANTDVPYLSLSTCPGEGYIVCGDNVGRLWTYHVGSLLPANYQRGKLLPPTAVFDWPGPFPDDMESPSINSVAMDPGLSYLVALTDANMVVVRKRVR